MSKLSRAIIEVRNLQRADFGQLLELYDKIYGKDSGLSQEILNGQITNFPEGQFVVFAEGKLIGHCASFRIKEEVAFKDHTYDEITAGGFASKHDPDGDYMYGMEVGVDEKYRGLRIGQRLYDARKKLCKDLGLKGICFGGRMPNYAKRKTQVSSPEEYVQKVLERKIKDNVIGFQVKNGFKFIKVLRRYNIYDKESGGCATLMVWENPHYNGSAKASSSNVRIKKSTVRVCSVQFQMREVKSKEEFFSQVRYFVEVASDYRADFVLFPEFLTIPLITIDDKKYSTTQNVERLADLTDEYVEALSKMAISHNINIIGGTHPTRTEEGVINNTAYVFQRDGSVHVQPKIHITPSEQYWRNIQGGNRVSAIETDCGSIGVLVCYDSEFPELSRHLVDQGINILFVPFCTDERQGYNRVRYCSQARAVENQIYVAMAGTVGNLPNVDNMDVNYAESCILTPCDFPFARDGIAATSIPNTEMVVMADLNFEELHASRKSGTVQNLRDRRLDLYKVQWRSK